MPPNDKGTELAGELVTVMLCKLLSGSRVGLALREMKAVSFPKLSRGRIFLLLLLLIVPFTTLKNINCLWGRLLLIQECLCISGNRIMIWS